MIQWLLKYWQISCNCDGQLCLSSHINTHYQLIAKIFSENQEKVSCIWKIKVLILGKGLVQSYTDSLKAQQADALVSIAHNSWISLPLCTTALTAIKLTLHKDETHLFSKCAKLKPEYISYIYSNLFPGIHVFTWMYTEIRQMEKKYNKFYISLQPLPIFITIENKPFSPSSAQIAFSTRLWCKSLCLILLHHSSSWQMGPIFLH